MWQVCLTGQNFNWPIKWQIHKHKNPGKGWTKQIFEIRNIVCMLFYPIISYHFAYHIMVRLLFGPWITCTGCFLGKNHNFPFYFQSNYTPGNFGWSNPDFFEYPSTPPGKWHPFVVGPHLEKCKLGPLELAPLPKICQHGPGHSLFQIGENAQGGGLRVGLARGSEKILLHFAGEGYFYCGNYGAFT